MTAMPDPRPIAATRCFDCGAGPDVDPAGDPHGWSCEQVPYEMFREHVVERRAKTEGEPHDR